MNKNNLIKVGILLTAALSISAQMIRRDSQQITEAKSSKEMLEEKALVKTEMQSTPTGRKSAAQKSMEMVDEDQPEASDHAQTRKSAARKIIEGDTL